jgi:hypothetical protein
MNNKMFKYGLFLIVVSLLLLFGLGLSAQKAYANVETLTTSTYTPAKNAAIKAADDSISSIRILGNFFTEEDLQKFVTSVNNARAMVNSAKAQYNAKDSDFIYFSKLLEAEKQAEKLREIQAARNAIDKIANYPINSNQYKAAVKEARRLTDIAVEKYGVTNFELCHRRILLEDAERKIAREMATPVTGGSPAGVILGLMFLGAGILFYRKAS